MQDFVDRAFAAAELEQDDRVVIDSGLLRPAEVDHLIGDASRARDELGWEPEVSFDRLVEMMVGVRPRARRPWRLSGAGRPP